MSDLPKMLSKREIELEELEEAKYVQSLRDDIEKLQERCDRYEKALEDIRTNTPIQELLNLPYGCACHEIASDALAAIGGDDE